MAGLAEIARRRARLQTQNDYLRLRLAAQYEQMRPAVVWIEQGYNLAHALSNSQEHSEPWTKRLIAMLLK